MKAILPLIGLTFLVLKSNSSFSQKDSSGIYFTADNYLKKELSFPVNCKTEKQSKSLVIMRSKDIIIRYDSATHKYPLDSIYAIKHCDNSVIRIYNDLAYPLVNPDEKIMIYKVVQSATGKGESTKVAYYFSKDAKSAIQKLTIYNIKSAFADNHKFHDLIDAGFHNDDELAQYDDFDKMMKINHVLQSSLKNN